MRDEEREGFVFLGKGDKVVKGKIKVSSYGEESCRGRQQCPAPERQKQVDFCQFRFESSLVWPTLQNETLSNKTTTITTKPEVFHRCDQNLCCVAVWNVRTSFSGFHEVKCLPPINKFHLFGGHVEFLSIARVGKNEATPGRAGVGGLKIVSVKQEETQESRVLIP